MTRATVFGNEHTALKRNNLCQKKTIKGGKDWSCTGEQR